MAALPPYKACEASALFTRSVAYLYTLCVYRQGSVPTLWEMPRSSIARAACYPDRGKLPACQEVPERETDCYFLRRAKSNTKSTRGKPCDLGSNRRPSHYFDRFSSFRQVTGYVQTTILQKIDGNDLNRCELQALHKRICNFVQVHSGFFGKQ